MVQLMQRSQRESISCRCCVRLAENLPFVHRAHRIALAGRSRQPWSASQLSRLLQSATAPGQKGVTATMNQPSLSLRAPSCLEGHAVGVDKIRDRRWAETQVGCVDKLHSPT